MTTEFDLRTILDVIVRRWVILVAMPGVAMLAAALATFAIPPTYEATATLALAPTTVSISLANQLPPYYFMVSEPRRLPPAYTPTYYIAVLGGADVLAAVKPQAGFAITSDSGDRSLLHITARGGNAKQVADAANAYAQIGAQTVTQVLRPTGDEARLAQQKFAAAEQALIKFAQDNRIEYDPAHLQDVPPMSRSQELQFMELMRTRDLAESIYLDFERDQQRAEILADSAYRPRVILAAPPTAPVAPKLAPTVLLGAAFGLLVGIAGAFALELLTYRRAK